MFKSQYKIDTNLFRKEDYRGTESLTIPDESYTIQELLQRHQAGISLNVQARDGYYEEMDDSENFDYEDRMSAPDFDLVDVTEAQIYQARMEQAKAKRKAAELEKKKSAKESKEVEDLAIKHPLEDVNAAEGGVKSKSKIKAERGDINDVEA